MGSSGCNTGYDVDGGRLERGGDTFSLFQAELFEGLAGHIGHKVKTAIEMNPVEEAERRELPDRSQKHIPCAGL